MPIFVECLKEDLRAASLDEVGWCPTECQLSDSLTKWMSDRLIRILMETGRWTPTGYELLRREDLPPPLGESEEEVVETFWCCGPSCVNCITAVATELAAADYDRSSVRVLFQRATSDPEEDNNASPELAQQHMHDPNSSPMYTTMRGPSPGLAHVALAGIYLQVLGECVRFV